MRNPNRFPTSLAALACVLALASSAVIAADAVYKWKDASGMSHYSQSPPPSGTKYETITPTGAPASSTATDDSGSPASGSTTFKTPEQTANTAARQAKRQQNCQAARANLALLNANPTANVVGKPIGGSASANGYNGPQATTSRPHAQEVARASGQVDAYCGK